MKRLFCAITLLCTLSNYAAGPTATFSNDPRDFFYTYVNGEKHTIIGTIFLNNQFFVEICSDDGTHKLIGKNDVVYDMPDLSQLNGINLSTTRGRQTRDQAFYASELRKAQHNPNIIFVSLLFHSFGVYGAYKLVRKAIKKYKGAQKAKPKTATA